MRVADKDTAPPEGMVLVEAGMERIQCVRIGFVPKGDFAEKVKPRSFFGILNVHDESMRDQMMMALVGRDKLNLWYRILPGGMKLVDDLDDVRELEDTYAAMVEAEKQDAANKEPVVNNGDNDV